MAPEDAKYYYELRYANGMVRTYDPVSLMDLRYGQFIPRKWKNDRPIGITVNPAVDADTLNSLEWCLHPKDSTGVINGTESGHKKTPVDAGA